MYADTIDLTVLAPLENFSCDQEEVELEHGLSIRRISLTELGDFMDSRFNSPLSRMSFVKYVVEHRYQTRKVIGNSRSPSVASDSTAMIPRVLTALRLFKNGNLGTNLIRSAPALATLGLLGVSSATYRMGGVRFGGPAYTLGAVEVRPFTEFWQDVKHLDFEHLDPLNVAIRRFEYSYERTKLEDKLVDYMVAFEALFFKKGEMGEFRHKLSVRVARFLTSLYLQRVTIASRITDFYDKRSAVVHGEHVELNDAFVQEVENYLRESIKLFLKRLPVESHEEIISRVDLE
jgi:hypothetical protein